MSTISATEPHWQSGVGRRVTVDRDRLSRTNPDEDVFEVHHAVDRLAAVQPSVANLVTLRYFGGRTLREAVEVRDLFDALGR